MLNQWSIWYQGKIPFPFESAWMDVFIQAVSFKWAIPFRNHFNALFYILNSHQLPFSVLAWCIGDITHNTFLHTDWDVFDWSKKILVIVLQFIFVGQILECFQVQWLIRLFRSSKRQTNLVMCTLQSLEDITGHLRKTHWSRCSEWTMGINAELVNFFTYTDRDREIGSNLLV